MAFEANANSENKSNSGNWFKGIFRFIVESKNELKRITWPTKQKIIKTTTVVLSAVLLLTAFVWLVDSVFNQGLHYFLNVLR